MTQSSTLAARYRNMPNSVDNLVFLDEFPGSFSPGCKKWSITGGAFFLLPIILLILIIPVSVSGAPDTIITLHGADWDSIKLNNAIVSYILEKGYGYQSVVIPSPEKRVADSLSSGETLVSIEVWKENHPPLLSELIQEKKILDLGPVYENASQNFIIPRHIAEAFHISTMADMKKIWNLFRDPLDSTKGLFYIGLISWWVHDANLQKMSLYDLLPYYNPVTLTSGRAYESAFMEAAQNNRAIFGHYWSPSSVMGIDYWTVLKEPDPSDSCIAQNQGSSDSISLICPFTNAQVHKLISPELQNRAPDIIPFLTAYHPGTDTISKTLAWGYLEHEENWTKRAEQYLINNPDLWRSWVNSGASKRIEESLRQ
jgi:glycine betaine/proline transport system substrate-binding protein